MCSSDLHGPFDLDGELRCIQDLTQFLAVRGVEVQSFVFSRFLWMTPDLSLLLFSAQAVAKTFCVEFDELWRRVWFQEIIVQKMN